LLHTLNEKEKRRKISQALPRVNIHLSNKKTLQSLVILSVLMVMIWTWLYWYPYFYAAVTLRVMGANGLRI